MTAHEKDEARRRYDLNVRFGRDLAEGLAVAAERIAVTFDRLAAVHEELATIEHHPLKFEALERAMEERKMAESERRASAWFRSIARSEYQAEAYTPALQDQRLPSQ